MREYLTRIANKETLLGRTLPTEDSLNIGESRRIAAAVLFVDICGFSLRALETQQDQDRTFRALALFFAEMARICKDYSGGVEKNTGDGLMAWFRDGDGTPAEKGTKRAVAAALTMMDVNGGALNSLHREMLVEPFNVRITVDYGNITVGNMGFPHGFQSNVAVGSTANFAAKMLSLAEPNQVLIGDSAKKALPEEWHQFTRPVDKSTGWSYLQSGEPYRAHEYFGRWRR